MPLDPELFISEQPDDPNPALIQPSHWNEVMGLLSRWRNNVFDAKDYGVKADGVTDDTAAIQLAIDSSYELIAGSGLVQEIFFPKGRIICGTLNFPGGGGTLSGAGGIHFVGSGKGNTTFVLKAGTNGPLLEIGGPDVLDGVNFNVFRDFSVDGNAANQTVAAPLVRVRRLDRGAFERVQISGSKGVGFEVTGSSIVVSNCESSLNASHGWVFDACGNTTMTACWAVDNAGYGLVAQFTNAALTGEAVFTRASDCSLNFFGNLFERNALGAVKLDSVEHTWVHHNYMQPVNGGVNSYVILVTGSAARNEISHNLFLNASAQGGGGPASSPNDFYVIRFDVSTFDNQYGWNQGTHSAIFGSVTMQCLDQVLDLGLNFSLEFTQFAPRQFGGLAGGHALGGWETQGRTNYLLYSEDMSNAVWTHVNMSLTQYSRSPISAATTGAFSTHYGLETPASPAGTLCSSTQTASGMPAIVAGDKWTLSVWASINSWALGQATDMQLRILDSSNNILAVAEFQLTADWKRYSCSWVANGSYSSLKGQLVKYIRGTMREVHVWGFCLAPGPLGPYVKTTSAVAVASRGFDMPRANISHLLTLGDGSIGTGNAGLTHVGYYDATFNPGAIANNATATVQQTVTGVALGDFVLFSYTATQQIAGLIITALVTAANTVQFQITNHSGSSVTPTGTGKLLVLRALRPNNV